MKKFFMLTTLLVGIMTLLPFAAASAASTKIGLIDTQKIMQESRAAKKARDAFLKDVEAKRAELRAKQEEVLALEEELKKERKKMSPSARKQKGEKLQKEIKELKRLRSDLEEELKKKDVELTQKLLLEIGGIVKEFSKKENYTVILEKKSVVAADEAIDITDKIIRLYDDLK